jgi:hypothetical protein
LINNCSNGVECTEDLHQLNRRSEFIISDWFIKIPEHYYLFF